MSLVSQDRMEHSPEIPEHPLARRADEPAGLVNLYLATLSPGSAYMTRWRLKLAAQLLTDGRLSADAVAWHRVSYPDALQLRGEDSKRAAAVRLTRPRTDRDLELTQGQERGGGFAYTEKTCADGPTQTQRR